MSRSRRKVIDVKVMKSLKYEYNALMAIFVHTMFSTYYTRGFKFYQKLT